MQPTLLANTWMAAHLPGEKYLALLCSAGTAGEAALDNSLDGAFAEAGYQYLPATLNRQRPPTYQVIGTSRRERKPMQRIVGTTSSIGRTIQFHDAVLLGNATTMTLALDAVAVDMTQMASLKILPKGFMRGCTSLTSILLPPNVEDIGDSVLSGCTSLVSLDMSALNQVKKLPDDFMRGCTSLEYLKLPHNFKHLEGAFLAGYTSSD